MPDEQLPRARDIALESGLRPIIKDTLNPCYSFEFANLGQYFSMNDNAPGTFARGFILVPLSWTGVSLGELQYVQDIHPPKPSTLGVLTLPRPVACATLMRLAARERRSSPLRQRLLAYLATIIAYGLFDMSYDGDYMVFKVDDEPESETERAEKEVALLEIKRWSWRNDELWMGEALAAVVAGTISYDDLPYLEFE